MNHCAFYFLFTFCVVIAQLKTVYSLRRDEVPDEVVSKVGASFQSHARSVAREPEVKYRDPYRMFDYDPEKLKGPSESVVNDNQEEPRKDPHKMFDYKPKDTKPACDCSLVENDLNSCLGKLSQMNSDKSAKDGTRKSRDPKEKVVPTARKARNSKEKEIPAENISNYTDTAYYRRAVILIGNQVKKYAREGDPATFVLTLSAYQASTLKNYAAEPSKDGMYAYRTLMIALEKIAPFDTSELPDPPALQGFNLDLTSLPLWLLLTLTALVILVFSTECWKRVVNAVLSPRSMLIFTVTLLINAFIVSVVWDFIYLYKLELAETEYMMLKGVPDCMKKETGFLASLRSFFVADLDHECKEYHRMKNINPLNRVTPAMAVVRTFSTVVFYPMVEFFRRIEEVIELVSGKYNIFATMLILIFLAIFFVVVCLIFCGYGFNSVLVNILAPVRSPLKMIADTLTAVVNMAEPPQAIQPPPAEPLEQIAETAQPTSGLPQEHRGSRVEDAPGTVQSAEEPPPTALLPSDALNSQASNYNHDALVFRTRPSATEPKETSCSVVRRHQSSSHGDCLSQCSRSTVTRSVRRTHSQPDDCMHVTCCSSHMMHASHDWDNLTELSDTQASVVSESSTDSQLCRQGRCYHSCGASSLLPERIALMDRGDKEETDEKPSSRHPGNDDVNGLDGEMDESFTVLGVGSNLSANETEESGGGL